MFVFFSECGRTFHDSNGTFGYPWFSDHLTSFESICQWRISGTHGEKIVLNISMIDIPDNLNCAIDYLEVRDGYWLKSPLLSELTISMSKQHKA